MSTLSSSDREDTVQLQPTSSVVAKERPEHSIACNNEYISELGIEFRTLSTHLEHFRDVILHTLYKP